MRKIFLLTLTALLIQIPAFANDSSSNLEANNPVQLISHISQYARVQGKIHNTDASDKTNVILLNFGDSFNTCFSAKIYDNAIPFFVMAGIDNPAEFFKEKNVEVEGIIRISNGKPELIIESPNQIKIVN